MVKMGIPWVVQPSTFQGQSHHRDSATSNTKRELSGRIIPGLGYVVNNHGLTWPSRLNGLNFLG